MQPASARERLERLERPRLLVVRNDGLGDFILTLPLVAALRRHLPGAQVTVLHAATVAPLLALLPDIDAGLADEGVLLKRHRGRFAVPERKRLQTALLEAVRAGGFHAALLPYAEPASARLVHRARIPVRAGPQRRSFFWRFNAPYRRTRRGSGLAEYELNLGYLECLGFPADYVQPRLALPAAALAAVRAEPPYAVLHPHKRSGTALTWPLEHFVALARRLAAEGLAVLAVGDPPDRPVLEQAFAGAPVRIETGLTLAELTVRLAGARLFVGNSSGPLHLAGLAGVPHVALYPQDRVSAPTRWRTLPPQPQGVPHAPADPAAYLLAPRFPKDCVTCEGQRCPYHNCVASLTPDAVWGALRGWGVVPAAASAGPDAEPGRMARDPDPR